MRFALLILLLCLPLPADANGNPGLCGHTYSQVESTQQRLEENRYNTARDMEEYDDHLTGNHPEMAISFRSLVANLPEKSVWIDMGAGNASALKEGLYANQNIRLGVGIAYRRPTHFDFPIELEKRFQYLDGSYVEEMMAQGKLNYLKGKANLISDLYGPFSYTHDIPRLMQTYFDLLKKDGTLVFNFHVSTADFRANPLPEMFNTVTKNGKVDESAFANWLRSIPGVEVVEEAGRVDGNINQEQTLRVLRVKKTAAQVTVPRNLETVQFQDGTPPLRKFRWNP